jgi:signal transduction histidine kinase
VTLVLPKPSSADVVLTSGLLLLGQLTTWLRLDSPDAFDGSRWANSAVLLLGTLPVLIRRFAPARTVAISAAILCLPHAMTDLDVTVLGQFVPLVVVTASAGYHAAARAASLAAAWSVACMLVVAWTTPFLRTPTSVLFNLLILIAPWAAARGLRHREERARRLGAALEHERSRFQDRMAQAVDRERAQIARDLHDIVAHGVSVMVVQVGGARLQLHEDPESAGRSLLAAEDAGRQALSDLRRMLGVLRASPTQPGTQPRLGLGQLDALVRQAGNAGVHVRLSTLGDVRELPAAVDLSAYRIMQEALTNVIKHSRSDRAEVTIEVTDSQLALTVRDCGPARDEPEPDGHGVVGIRERVAFFGGETRIGTDGSGGWQVAVTIPWTSPSPAAESSGPGPREVPA